MPNTLVAYSVVKAATMCACGYSCGAPCSPAVLESRSQWTAQAAMASGLVIFDIFSTPYAVLLPRTADLGDCTIICDIRWDLSQNLEAAPDCR